MPFPTLTEIEDANWDYLTTNATAWTNLANSREAAFTQIRDASTSPGGVPWTGTGAQAFQHRAAADVVKVHDPADMLRNAAGIATRGAQAQQGNKSLVLSAVNTAERQDFRVGDDYSVTDTWTYYFPLRSKLSASRPQTVMPVSSSPAPSTWSTMSRRSPANSAPRRPDYASSTSAKKAPTVARAEATGCRRPRQAATLTPPTQRGNAIRQSSMTPRRTPPRGDWLRHASMTCGIPNSSAHCQPIRCSAATRVRAPKPDDSSRISSNLVRPIQTGHR